MLIRVEGIVQGVGFRPYVHSLAGRLALSGWVGNDGQGVFIEVEGAPDDLTRFQEELHSRPPPLALIHRLTATPLPVRGDRGFRIAASRGGDVRTTLVAPDAATCADCLAELFDPADRRHRHAFVNCTGCGPRFTIVLDVPYDRPATTMAAFPMCEACAAEYADPLDRRFHAQPICCPACGPTLRLLDAGAAAAGGPAGGGDPIKAAAELLRAGDVVAVKGLGGYHLAVDTGNESAVRGLRARKHRPDQPFAVMVPDLDAARRLCELDADAEALLLDARRPIVLLPRRPDAPVAESVAPGNRHLGLMLPYTPVHHLLARELAGPYVLSSGNRAGEPIAHRDEDAFARLAGIADHFLTHDRPIHVRADDSVVRAAGGVPVRRSRGYAPQPLWLTRPAPRALLACGAELKNTFCLVNGDRAFLSPHIGDLADYETLRSFTEGIEHFRRLFGVTPRLVAHDLHPDYLSTKYAMGVAGVDLLGVQHHHAHIASCLADNGEEGPVIGVAFDGTGYGPDGTLWGGELLIADLTGFTRAGHLSPVPLPGGAAAIRQPWRMAAAHLDVAYAGSPPAGLAVAARNRRGWDAVRAMAGSGVNAPLTSSAGRLFDAVAALLGVRDAVTYEGQAAIELEQLADPTETSGYPAGVLPGDAPACSARVVPGAVALAAGDALVIQAGDLVRAVVDDLHAGAAPATIAARFHNGLAAAARGCCVRLRDRTGIGTVALSGGVFQNRLLLDRLTGELGRHGFRVLTHHRVPPNDGGISLGQAAIAAASDALDRR
jgi:hydrogenase maturation protein HypF